MNYLLKMFVYILCIVILYIREEKEIAVVYFRAGYTPNDYHSETVIK